MGRDSRCDWEFATAIERCGETQVRLVPQAIPFSVLDLEVELSLCNVIFRQEPKTKYVYRFLFGWPGCLEYSLFRFQEEIVL